MLFPTVQFAVFFPVVLALSWALMSRPALWKPFIIVASYTFYAEASSRFCLLLGGVTLGNQLAARLLAATDERPAPRTASWSRPSRSTSSPSGCSSTTRSSCRASRDALHAVGLGTPLPLLTIALPVGISFFTFQAISYVVDVYRRTVVPSSLARRRRLPQLLPAPGRRPDRARTRVPAAAAERRATRRASRSAPASALIALGLVKKVVIADYLARSVVDPVFARASGLRRARRRCSPRTRTPRRSTATSRATPTSRSGSRC